MEGREAIYCSFYWWGLAEPDPQWVNNDVKTPQKHTAAGWRGDEDLQ